MSEFLDIMKEDGPGAAGTSMAEAASRIVNFEEKYTAFVDLINNTSGMAGYKRAILMKEAEGTSDFPTLFGTVLERQLRAKYMLNQPDWKSYVKVGTQNDFRMSWDIALYGNRSQLSVVKERADYKAGTALADGKFVIGLQKYGRLFQGLSWEAMINDDLGAFSDIANDLVLSAQLTESKYVTQLFAGASGPLAYSAPSGTQSAQTGLFSVSAAHPIDGTTFSNYQTSYPLTASNLLAAITQLKSQKDYDGNPIMFRRFYLVVPIGKESTAMQLLSNNLLIATALTSSSATGQQPYATSENILTRYPLTAVTNPWLDIVSGSTYGPYSWYLFGDPADGDAIRFNYLRGHETPEVCQKMSDKISLGGAPISPLEGDFDSDTIQWRIRDVFGGTTTDPRFAFGAQSTT